MENQGFCVVFFFKYVTSQQVSYAAIANFFEKLKRIGQQWVLGMVLLWVIYGSLMEWETTVNYIFFLIILFMNIYKHKNREN